MKLYIVEALRWGSRENHSYIVGIYDTHEQAKVICQEEEQYRGGKYKCEIEEKRVNDNEDIPFSISSFNV